MQLNSDLSRKRMDIITKGPIKSVTWALEKKTLISMQLEIIAILHFARALMGYITITH